jgi:hypothetical protein
MPKWLRAKEADFLEARGCKTLSILIRLLNTKINRSTDYQLSQADVVSKVKTGTHSLKNQVEITVSGIRH